MLPRRALCLSAAILVLGWPFVAPGQRAVRLPGDVVDTAVAGVQLDPATRVDPVRMPRALERTRLFESLGLAADAIESNRAVAYSADHLEDDAARLTVFYMSLVKQRDRWVFWSDESPADPVRGTSEIQLALETERETRYLVDFVLDSAEQDFAVLLDGVRTTQTPAEGHVALIVAGTGRRQTLRVLPAGGPDFDARRYTLFEVRVAPLR